MVHHLVIGIIFLIWGIADVLRLELPGILGKRLESASADNCKNRRKHCNPK